MASAGYDNDALVAAFGQIITLNQCGVAGFALLVHEYLITFHWEVELFWNRRMTGAVLLFLANRYIVLATLTFAVSGVMVSFPRDSCSTVAIVTNALAILQYIPWAAFSGMRAYALSRGNIMFTALISLLSLVPTHFVFGIAGVIDPVLNGCVIVDHVKPALGHKLYRLTIASRVSLVAADALLLLATWIAIPNAMRGASRGHRRSFSTVLLRDGTLYFGILLVLNALHLAFTVRAIHGAPFQAASYVIQLIHPITGVLVSRFLLDLQDANRHALDLASRSRSALCGDGNGGRTFGDAGADTLRFLHIRAPESAVWSVVSLGPDAEQEEVGGGKEEEEEVEQGNAATGEDRYDAGKGESVIEESSRKTAL
ncbi:hypothetical protein C8Q76DRAFT_792774 [Earliella scabrosa]|nr:hypothetical protein C8Q76DRAFT_792774 [Earliella scabrosa]